MSRATRPLRRVRGADRDRLREAVYQLTGWRGVARPGRRMSVSLSLAAYAFGMCRPAQLRRCLLGRPVSARAAERILKAAVGRP